MARRVSIRLTDEEDELLCGLQGKFEVDGTTILRACLRRAVLRKRDVRPLPQGGLARSPEDNVRICRDAALARWSGKRKKKKKEKKREAKKKTPTSWQMRELSIACGRKGATHE